MNKKVKTIIVLILVIIVCIAVFFTFKNSIKTEETNNESQNLVEENVIEENIIEQNEVKSENFVEQNVIENKSSQEMQNPSEVVLPSSSIYESDSDVGTTDKKQEAIELVKEKWGEDSSVSFRCDQVTENGEYIIAVVSYETATVRNYFKVNLENKTVEVDY